MKKFIASLLLLVPLLSPVCAFSQTTRYVSDELEITMRAGQGVKFGIRKMLTSGDKLEVIETDPTGYSKVRTEQGVVGWVLTRYLSNAPSARERLSEAEQQVANLELDIAGLKEEIDVVSQQKQDILSNNMGLRETAQRLRNELDDLRRTASSAVALDNENRQLKEKLQQMDHHNQALIVENNALKDNSTKTWFLIGAAVLFAGILLGLLLPRLRVQKKDRWGSI